MLSEEQRLRLQLERDLSEKSEELLREKSKNLRSSGGVGRSLEGRYSPLDYSRDYSGGGYLDELDASKALNYQVNKYILDKTCTVYVCLISGLLLRVE